MDIVLLSRSQFAQTTAVHVVFPVRIIGLSLYLVVVEWTLASHSKCALLPHVPLLNLIFFIHFAFGVVRNITPEFESGAHFSRYSQTVSNVFAPLMNRVSHFTAIGHFRPKLFMAKDMNNGF